MFNLNLRRIRATIAGVEKQCVVLKPSVCICSLRYPVCNAHAPYCQMWLAPLCNISTHYLINGTISKKKY